MFAQKYGREYPVLLTLEQPRDRVKLIEVIGRGNYGTVYKGSVVGIRRMAAIKVVTMKYEELAETLLEMEILRDCKHENITEFLSSFADDTRLWICIEFCEMGSLDHVYRNVTRGLSEEEIASIVYDTTQGLCYLHYRHNIIHRDIKAGNILIDKQGVCKLTDFGVSSRLRSLVSRTNTFIGTPYWMAPEVICTGTAGGNSRNANISYNYKIDIWSLGITAIEISQKKPPLSDLHPMRALELIPSAPIGLEKPKNWSKTFQSFISSCLIKDPNERPTTMQLLEHPFIKNYGQMNRREIIKKLALLSASRSKGDSRRHKDGPIVENCSEIGTAIAKTVITSKKTQKSHTKASKGRDLASKQSEHIIMNHGTRLSIDTPEPSISLFCPVELCNVAGIYHVNSVAAITPEIILIGADTGLYFLAPSQTSSLNEVVLDEPFPIVMKTKFVQLEVVRQCNVLLALAGKKLRVRQYDLKNITGFIYYVIDKISKGDFNLDAVKSSVKTGNPNPGTKLKSAIMSSSFASPAGLFYPRGNAFRYSGLCQPHQGSVSDDSDPIGPILNPHYIKLTSTKSTSYFSVVRTVKTCFLTTISANRVTIHEWAGQPYSKFMKLKGFWVPELPKFVDLVNDCINVIEIVALYKNDLTLIEFETGNVRVLSVPQAIFQNKTFNEHHWSVLLQAPFTEEDLKSLTFSDSDVVHANLLRPEQFLQDLRNRANKNPNNLSSGIRFLGVCENSIFLLNPDGTLAADKSENHIWKDGFTFPEVISRVFFFRDPLMFAVMGRTTLQVVCWYTLAVLQTIKFESGLRNDRQVHCTILGLSQRGLIVSAGPKNSSREIVLLNSESHKATISKDKASSKKDEKDTDSGSPAPSENTASQKKDKTPPMAILPYIQSHVKQKDKSKPVVASYEYNDKIKQQKTPPRAIQTKLQAYYFQPASQNVVSQNSKSPYSPYYVQAQSQLSAAALQAPVPFQKAPPRRSRPARKPRSSSHNDVTSVYYGKPSQ